MNNFFYKIFNKIRLIFVNIIIKAIKYDRMNFVSFLQKNAHEKTVEILGDDISDSLFFENKHDLWGLAIEKVINDKKESNKKKVCLEFGVGGGESIRFFANKFLNNDIKIIGFDSFYGNPEVWPGTENKVGSSNQYGKVPKNLPSNVEIVKGYIEETLSKFLEENNITKIDFIHVDVNIYSAAKIILEKTKKHMNKNSLILFDELVNYPFWWKNGEFKALIETYNKNEYKYVAFDRAKKSLIQIV